MPKINGVFLTSTRRVRGAWLAASFAVLAVLGGVVVSGSERCPHGCQVTAAPRDLAESEPAVPTSTPAALAVMPAPASEKVNPAGPVLVTATTGTITDVTMTNDSGKAIPGVLTPDHTAWKPTVQLGYGRTYKMTIAGARPQRHAVAARRPSFTTVSPSNQTQVYLDTTGGGMLQDGATYGVGMVVVAHFDEAIDNKANAERHLSVTTNPPVPGSWYWVDDQNAHWRPREVLRAGHDGHRRGQPLRHPARRRSVRRAGRAGVVQDRRRARLDRRRQHQAWSASTTTASWCAPCRRRWAWAASRPSRAPRSRSSPRRASTR